MFTPPLDIDKKIDNIPQQETKKSSVIDFLTVDGVYVDEIIQISDDTKPRVLKSPKHPLQATVHGVVKSQT